VNYEDENPLHYDPADLSYDSDNTTFSTFDSPDEPMPVARQLLEENHTTDKCTTLRYWRSGWNEWNGTVWAEAEKKAVERWAYERLEHAVYSGEDDRLKKWKPNRRKIGDLLDALAAITHLPETVHPPTWLGRETFPADEAVMCANGILHVPTRTLHALTPWYFSQVAVPFSYDPDAPDPELWLRFLGQLWPGDRDCIDALQEWFGYVLSGRTDLHKIGPTRSGKGTIARVLSALVGTANVASPTLASMQTNFGLSPLIGKPLAIIGDARLGDSGSHQVVERLLMLSGEDMLTVDRKYKDPWTGKLPSRILIISNELPQLGDASGAIAARFIVLTMTRSFLGKENHALTDQLLEELPGILRWSLDGFDRLMKNDRFTVPQASSDAVLALQDLVSPVSAFKRDECQDGGEVACKQLYAVYREWCDENGHKPRSEQGFGKDLRSVFPALRVTQPRTEEGRERVYVEISLRGTYIAPPRVPRVPAEPDPSDSEPVARAGTRDSPMWPGLANVRCPSCGWRFKTAVQPGETAWCKKCAAEFTVPDESR
jgi:putative DNA primase/helicase